MKKIIRSMRALLLVTIVATISSVAIAGKSQGDAPKNSPRKILEVNVTDLDTSERDNGQPAVAVNPKNPDNLVFISTNHLRGPSLTPDKWKGLVAYSMDGSKTWTQVPWPYGNPPMAGDPYLSVDPDGIFYIAFNQLGCPSGGSSLSSCNGVPNYVMVARSLDGGQTWSAPVNTGATVGTTPRLRVDMATGKIYAVGGTSGPALVSVSANQGLTWTPGTPLPNQPFRNQIAVHDGILATATAIGSISITTPSYYDFVGLAPMFYVSFDDGQTFSSFPVTDSKGNPVPVPEGFLVPTNAIQTSDPIPWVTADPRHSGRFAVMLPRGNNLEVYITNDAGQTWTGPTVIAAPGAAKPWIEFGPTGLLGVMWRTIAPDAVNVYSVVSFNRGKSFSSPIKINYTTNTYGSFTGTGGDEWSRILLDGKYAYITWSDSRRTDGYLDGIVSRVPVSLYNCDEPRGKRRCQHR